MTVSEGKTVITKIEFALLTPQLSGSEAFYEINALRYSKGRVQLCTYNGPMEHAERALKDLIRSGAKFYAYGKLTLRSDCACINVSGAMCGAEKIFGAFPEFELQDMPKLPLEGYCSREFDEMLRMAYAEFEESLISDMLWQQ